MSIRDFLLDAANEFQNDWLTVAKFAEHHGLTDEEAYEFLRLAQAVRSHDHPDA